MKRTEAVTLTNMCMIKNKNKILEDLKQKSLSSYEIPHITEVTVRVNPGTKSCVRDNLFRY